MDRPLREHDRRQKKDGSWSNDFSTWMKSDPNLCTGYALQTLAICKSKTK